MNIRAVGLTPNYSKYNAINAVSFGEKEVDDNLVEYKGRYVKDVIESAYVKGGMFGMLIGALTVLGTQAARENKEQQFSKAAIENFVKIAESDEIQKDTFLVKDVTGDEKPDMILFKKDGTRVVFDMAEGKIKEEITETKFKEIK